MSKVIYGQRGYIRCSMSEGAAEAYRNGEKPRSRWSKALMIRALLEYAWEFDVPLERAALDSMRKCELFSRFFEEKSWHHTGKYAQWTQFFGINEDAVREFSNNGNNEI